MKKSSRRRLLLSSVVMLLVAVFALGTATYAWFTNSSTAKATGVNVSTTKLSNLQVCETNSADDSDWGNKVDFRVNEQLMPASTGNLTAWYATTAANETAYDRDTEAEITDVTGNESYVVAKTFFIRSKDVDAENVKWSLDLGSTDPTAMNYLRVALVGGDGNVVWSSNETSTAGLTSTDGATTSLASSGAVTGTLFEKLTKDTAKQLTLYVWFEGQDTNCYNGTAGCSADVTINFSKS